MQVFTPECVAVCCCMPRCACVRCVVRMRLWWLNEVVPMWSSVSRVTSHTFLIRRSAELSWGQRSIWGGSRCRMNLFRTDIRFVWYLTGRKFSKFWIIGLQFWSRDPEDMEMSVMNRADRLKALSNPAGPASGRNRPRNNRNLGFGHEGNFF